MNLDKILLKKNDNKEQKGLLVSGGMSGGNTGD